MEKRNWLWKRKSSERGPGETESSGSVSSPSERFSDEQDISKASPNEDSPSPEVTSKASERDEDVDNRIKQLTEKLSAALVNVSAKDDLVKQHSKVAEEAVAGWEKAENEVTALKQQLESAVQQKSALEDRVAHLDSALKECVRQLRQARDEDEEKLQEALAKKTQEWESTKSELENQIIELKSEAQTAKSASPSPFDPDFYDKLEQLGKDNASLKLDLYSLLEELEVRTIERDLSTQAAEAASKQHLESIKKVAKLEAECRRLKSLAYKATPVSDQKISTASSICVESFTDCSQSENGERLNSAEPWASALIAELDQFKNEKAVNRSVEIDLMDDFLEMERLAAIPEPEKRETNNAKSQAVEERSNDGECLLRAELEVMVQRVADLEEKLQKQSDDKESLLRDELEVMVQRVADLEEKLQKRSDDKESLLRDELEVTVQRVADLEEKLQKVEGEKAEIEEKLEKIMLERTELEMTLTISQEKNEELQTQLREAGMKLDELQEELLMMNESKEEIESQLVIMEAEVRTTNSKANSFEAEAEKERALSAELNAKCKALEEELCRTKQEIESQLVKMEAEVRSTNSKAYSFEAEAEKERALSAELNAKCKSLEEELCRTKEEIELQQSAIANVEPKIKQEDIAVAAGKLAECQKTIASLGKQLKSLATLEDFLIDTVNVPEFSAGESVVPKPGFEPWRLHSIETFSPSRDSNFGPEMSRKEGQSPPSSSSSSSAVPNPVSYEKNRNGFAKFFSRSKNGNGIQLEI